MSAFKRIGMRRWRRARDRLSWEGGEEFWASSCTNKAMTVSRGEESPEIPDVPIEQQEHTLDFHIFSCPTDPTLTCFCIIVGLVRAFKVWSPPSLDCQLGKSVRSIQVSVCPKRLSFLAETAWFTHPPRILHISSIGRRFLSPTFINKKATHRPHASPQLTPWVQTSTQHCA